MKLRSHITLKNFHPPARPHPALPLHHKWQNNTSYSTVLQHTYSSSATSAMGDADPNSKSKTIHDELNELTQPPHGKWHLREDPRRLERSFKFPDFAAAWKFMAAVAVKCEEKNHHPEWSNVYNQVFIRWTTHKPPGGVRKKDRELAAICDELASLHGASAEDDGGGAGDGQAPGDGLDALVGGVSNTARDCCADGTARS